LPKYIYKPILEIIKQTYFEHTKNEYVPGLDIESNVRIVIEAENEAEANNARMGFVDTRMWELVQD
jgi:hypothetical protein